MPTGLSQKDCSPVSGQSDVMNISATQIRHLHEPTWSSSGELDSSSSDECARELDPDLDGNTDATTNHSTNLSKS